jgi:transcription elongation GreA/GreB family factor
MIKLPMTAAGYSALENELKHRVRVERARLIQRIQEAIADDSNRAENLNIRLPKQSRKSMRLALPSLKTNSRVRKLSTCRSFPVPSSNSVPRLP